MSRTLPQFLDQFVLPLLMGGDVLVTGPIRPKEHRTMLADADGLSLPALGFARLRRAHLVVADPELGPPDDDELSLWVGLFNVLALDHPERTRVWARDATWSRVEGTTRSWLTLPSPSSRADGLARHLSVGALTSLERLDTVVAIPGGEVRYAGQDLPRARLRFTGLHHTGDRQEVVRWRGQDHAPEVVRLLDDAMRASPLTCLLDPLSAPADWSPLQAVEYLQDRAFARAVCHAWSSHPDWVRLGAAVTRSVLSVLAAEQQGTGSAHAQSPQDASRPLALSGTTIPTDPAALAAVVGALIHLHVLRVLELEARLGVALGSRDAGVQAFLALPLLLPRLQLIMGSPLGGLGSDTTMEAQMTRRWAEYVDHLEELLPRTTVENVVATLVPRIVKAR